MSKFLLPACGEELARGEGEGSTGYGNSFVLLPSSSIPCCLSVINYVPSVDVDVDVSVNSPEGRLNLSFWWIMDVLTCHS